MALNIVIMAAGKGTRMKSATPKVLHKLAGRSLLAHVLKSCEPLAADARIVITGRFHGLANGLSMGVPCHAISWSHKYGELLDDFGRPDALFTGDADDFCRRVEAELSDASRRAQEQERLRRVALAKKVELQAMWDQIAEDIQATA